MSHIKGGKLVTRQNFSMHPDLLKAILSAANILSLQRSKAILHDRSRRVTYSKVVSALIFDAIKRGLIRQEGDAFVPTAGLEALVTDYEASDFERLPVNAERAAFRRTCHAYGLRMKDYRRPFLWQGRRVSLVEIDAANASAPLVVEDEGNSERLSLALSEFNDAPWAPDEGEQSAERQREDTTRE